MVWNHYWLKSEDGDRINLLMAACDFYIKTPEGFLPAAQELVLLALDAGSTSLVLARLTAGESGLFSKE